VRTRLTFLDFAVGTAFATIPLTLDYEGTVSCRAILFPPIPELSDHRQRPVPGHESTEGGFPQHSYTRLAMVDRLELVAP
jgi:hypothetical protein